MSKLIITRGYPGSGKTTYAKKWLQAPDRIRVNRDDLRQSLYGREGVLDVGKERYITHVQQKIARASLQDGVGVICDDMNLRLSYAKQWAKLAREEGAEFEVIDIDTDVQTCIARNRMRRMAGERFVDEDVINTLAHKFPFPLRPVVLEDEAVPVLQTYVARPDKPAAWLVDVDGTLALMGNRSPYAWAEVGQDTVNHPVKALVAGLSSTSPYPRMIVMSGRDSVCRDATFDWLRNNHIYFNDLHMRAFGDQRKDSIVKYELFNEHIRDHYNVIGVIDDRKQVVNMWRSIGLFVAQVAPGEF